MVNIGQLRCRNRPHLCGFDRLGPGFGHSWSGFGHISVTSDKFDPISAGLVSDSPRCGRFGATMARLNTCLNEFGPRPTRPDSTHYGRHWLHEVGFGLGMVRIRPHLCGLGHALAESGQISTRTSCCAHTTPGTVFRGPKGHRSKGRRTKACERRPEVGSGGRSHPRPEVGAHLWTRLGASGATNCGDVDFGSPQPVWPRSAGPARNPQIRRRRKSPRRTHHFSSEAEP